MPPIDPVIIPYDSPTTAPGAGRLASMRVWQWVCCAFFAATIGAIFFVPMIAPDTMFVALVAGLVAIAYMGLAARAEVNAAYAARHVALAIILSLIGLLGVWLVPLLVESDLSKWRRREEQKAGEP